MRNRVTASVTGKGTSRIWLYGEIYLNRTLVDKGTGFVMVGADCKYAGWGDVKTDARHAAPL